MQLSTKKGIVCKTLFFVKRLKFCIFAVYQAVMHAATLMSSEQVRAAISRRSECGYQQRRALREGSTARKSNPDAMEIGKAGDKKGKGKGDEKERKGFQN